MRILSLILAAGLFVQPIVAAGAAQDISRDLDIDFSQAFHGDHVRISGRVTNRSAVTHECVVSTFAIEARGGTAQRSFELRDLGAGQSRDFTGVLPPGKGVRYLFSESCQVALPRPPVPTPGKAPAGEVTVTASNCTIHGQLTSRNGFRARINGRDVTLSQIRLYDSNGRAARTASFVERGGQASYSFADVPAGRQYFVKIDGALLNNGGSMVAECRRGEQSLMMPGAMVSPDSPDHGTLR